MRQTTIRINQSALQHNLQRVKTLAPHSQVVAMVKANAYGHGVEQVLPALDEADIFGVACLEEALTLRQLGCQKPILLIEGVTVADDMPIAIQHGCHCVVHHAEQIDWLRQHQQTYQQAGLQVWIKLNTGMNRLGFRCDDLNQLDTHIQPLIDADFACVIAMHFANADEPSHPLNAEQIATFHRVRQRFPNLKYSCCNSAGILNWADLHLDYVRPGIMLYGSSPFADRSAQDLQLHAVMQFHTQVIAIYDLKANDKVGYASSFVAKQAMTIAVLAVGYGDGYPRAYRQPIEVLIHGHRVPVIGRISMDMMTVDISKIKDLVKLDDHVELWGEHLSVDEIAQAHDTIGYELLCRTTNRPKREVIK